MHPWLPATSPHPHEKPYLIDEIPEEFLWQGEKHHPPPLWIWYAYLIHVERVGDQSFVCTNQSMLSINQSYFMIFSLLNQSLKAMFFTNKIQHFG
jgi:hypothetical protein